jgi:hypothetical protein
MTDSAALIGIWDTEDQDSEYISYAYIKEGDIIFRAPASPGSYELRAYSSDRLIPQNLKTTTEFTVSDNSLAAFRLSVDKNEYKAGEKIIVNVNEVPHSMFSDLALVGIYRSGAKSNEYLTFWYLSRRDQEIYFDAPEEGEYEIRAYSNPSVWSDETLVAQIAIKVLKEDDPAESKNDTEISAGLQPSENLSE